MSDEVREAYIAWVAVWEAERGRPMTPTESNAAWAAWQAAHRRARVGALRELHEEWYDRVRRHAERHGIESESAHVLLSLLREREDEIRALAAKEEA